MTRGSSISPKAKQSTFFFLSTRKGQVGEAIRMEKVIRRGRGDWITRKTITGIVTVIGWIGHITVTKQLARYWEWNLFLQWGTGNEILTGEEFKNGLITTSEVLRIWISAQWGSGKKNYKKVTFHRNWPGTGHGKSWRGTGDWSTPQTVVFRNTSLFSLYMHTYSLICMSQNRSKQIWHPAQNCKKTN